MARLAWRNGLGSAAMSLSARARPSGLRVSSTADASARYSRRRETANCTAYAASGARMASTSATMAKIALAWSPPESLPRRRPPIPPQKLQRRKKSAMRAIMPTRMPTSVSKRMS